VEVVMRASLLILLLAVAACDWRKFDDLESATWAEPIERPDFVGAQNFGFRVTGVVPASGGGALVAVIASDGLVVVTFDEGGSADTIDNVENGALSVADAGGGRLAVGYATNITIYDQPGTLGGQTSVFDTPQTGLGSVGAHLAGGDFDGAGGHDLIAGTSNGTLLLLPDGADAALASCTLPGTIVAMVASETDDEVVVLVEPTGGGDPGFARISGVDISGAAGGACPFVPSTPNFGGDSIAVGDVDGDSLEDVVVAGDGQAELFPGAGGNVAIGGSELDCAQPLSVAIGDFTPDADDEILVGNPCTPQKDTADVGTLFLYDVNASATDPAVQIYDSEPEDEQHLGVSLATVPFDGAGGQADIVVAGANGEAWVYFKLVSSAPDPRGIELPE
jgi:hypothetical protein